MLLVLTLPALIKESFTKFDVIEYYIFAIRRGSLCALQVLYRGDNNHGGAMERGRFEETQGHILERVAQARNKYPLELMIYNFYNRFWDQDHSRNLSRILTR